MHPYREPITIITIGVVTTILAAISHIDPISAPVWICIGVAVFAVLGFLIGRQQA